MLENKPQGKAGGSRGVVDLVFVIDATYSMKPCIEALKQNISNFITSLTTADANGSMPVRDWRGKIVGYRDYPHDSTNWIIDPPFVASAEELRKQLFELEPMGGGSEPESLLDALLFVARMDEAEKGSQEPDGKKWRHRRDAARVVVVFTDATFHPVISVPEGEGGTVVDVRTALAERRIIMSVFAPDFPCYQDLALVDRCEYEAIPIGSEGPQAALASYTSDTENFKMVMKQLAASVSKSASEPTL